MKRDNGWLDSKSFTWEETIPELSDFQQRDILS